jgi:predicted O-methyltransferase YrrM
MLTELNALTRRVLSKPMHRRLVEQFIRAHATLSYPKNRCSRFLARRRNSSTASDEVLMARSCRRFDYEPSRLPNAVLSQSERSVRNLSEAMRTTGFSIGYPAWNLLYYALLCSLPVERKDFVVVETGTNHGFSSIVLAQALKDLGATRPLHTIDIDPQAVAIARQNVARAGLDEFVEFHVDDSLRVLATLTEQVEAIHFAFLDGDHAYDHVRREFAIIYPMVVTGHGTVYFDNTTAGGVARALRFIRRAYGGNLVEFRNCSWGPPGNAIWQAD